MKKLSNVIIPDAAKAPVLADQVASLPVFALGTPPPRPGPTPAVVPAADRAALVALYHATDGPNWINNTSWLSDRPSSEWVGVLTNDSGRVTELDLSLNSLNGEIPAPLGQLTSLTELDLSGKPVARRNSGRTRTAPQPRVDGSFAQSVAR